MSTAEEASTSIAHHVPEDLLQDTFKKGALKYKTRGLTSSIHTYSLSRLSPCETLQKYLVSLRASPALLVIKSVDLEEQVRPHDIKLEIGLLTKLNSEGKDTRSEYVVQLLATAEETPDDFTSIQRLYFPYYPLTLSEWLDQDANSLDAAKQVRKGYTLATQLYSALAYLHSRNVYHRDVKPSNILLTSKDILSDQFQIKLCDFGTGVQLADGDLPAKTCSTSTHPYTPPELLFSPKNGYDASKVDVWEAACVIAEIFGPTQEDVQSGQGPTRKRSYQDIEQCDEADEDPFGEAPASSSSQLQLFPDNGDEDDEDEDEFWGSSSTTTKNDDDQWKSLQRTLFSNAPNADDTWLRKGHTKPSLSAPLPAPPQSQPQATQRQHRPLFPRSNPSSLGGNDLSLAAAHFEFCGLPSLDQQHLWPESIDYQPSFQRLPFKRSEPPKQPQELLKRCALLQSNDMEEENRVHTLVKVLLGSLELSPGKRLAAQECQDLLSAQA